MPVKSKVVILFLLSVTVSTAQDWGQISDFPAASRDDGTGFVLGDSAYFGTGVTPWFAPLGNFYGLNLRNDQWFDVASLPAGEERQYAAGFNSLEHGFIMGGFNGTDFLNDVWQYNPQTNTWTEKTALPSAGRSGAACFILNDTAYIIGGKTANNVAINEVWAYAMLTDSWIQKSNLPNGNRWRGSATAINNTGYLLFGRDEVDVFHNDLLAYNSSSDSWTQVSSFPFSGRSHASLVAVDDQLLVCFGYDSLANFYNDLWAYIPQLNNWNILPGIPADGRRGGIALVAPNETVYYSTGLSGQGPRIKETWKYHKTLSFGGVDEINEPKNLVKIINLLGQEVAPSANTLLIYVYDDGSFEKVILSE